MLLSDGGEAPRRASFFSVRAKSCGADVKSIAGGQRSLPKKKIGRERARPIPSPCRQPRASRGPARARKRAPQCGCGGPCRRRRGRTARSQEHETQHTHFTYCLSSRLFFFSTLLSEGNDCHATHTKKKERKNSHVECPRAGGRVGERRVAVCEGNGDRARE